MHSLPVGGVHLRYVFIPLAIASTKGAAGLRLPSSIQSVSHVRRSLRLLLRSFHE